MLNAVKFVKGSRDLIEGCAIPFGSPDHKDLDGEFFTKDTDFALDWFETRPLLYHHGLDVTKTAVIGRVKSYEIKDDGLWVQSQLDKRSRYLDVVRQLIGEDALGMSSGTMPHLVETDSKTGEIKVWPWVEESLTPTPANPDAIVYAVKSADLFAHLNEIETAIPTQLVAAIMKSFDERDGSALESYTQTGQRVLADLKAFVALSEDRQAFRAKSDRLLSGDDRSRLIELQSYIWTISSDVDALLRVSDPKAADRASEAQQLLTDFVAIEARLNGVMV